MPRFSVAHLRRVAAGAALATAALTLGAIPAGAEVTSAVAIAPLRPVPKSDGTVTFRLRAPGPGTVSIRETASQNNFATGFGLTPAPKPGARFVFASETVTAHAAANERVSVTPNTAGQRLIAHHTYLPLVRLWVTFTPNDGAPSDIGVYGLQIPAGRGR
jgi:hypothetical protein